MIKKLFRSLNYRISKLSIIKAIINYNLHTKHQSKIQINDKLSVIDLENGKVGRYLFNLVHTLQLSGFDVMLKADYKFYSSCSGLYLKEVFTELRVMKFNRLRLNNYQFKYLFSDNEQAISQNIYSSFFNIDYKCVFEGYKYILPFPFHPLNIIKNDLFTLPKYVGFLVRNRRIESNKRIMFGGSYNNPMYNKLGEKFPNILNRNVVVNKVVENFSECINTEEAKIEILSPPYKKINHGNWIENLAKSDFFIAAPGFEMPFCHNIIEAMSVGVIPIIQYGYLFNPNLENKVNCLVFKDEQSLLDCISCALKMTDYDISKMKENVITYFDTYLAPPNFFNEVIGSEKVVSKIGIIAGELSL